ncbi:MASE1 domain-containing protein [Crenobacter sp. SG2303]|uniref:MASE1 domain-containing protein n=1 Tax=Crenobacter oryzisoli TaxID=3056844 RepID=A0ABT7XQW5_9NEIS|nr:MASE1 domain-containing protein [Crenobacter sp. SG2303]MDN0076170.1 MASE1 domain-containing protein [Crenobacter sp. SG2303]
MKASSWLQPLLFAIIYGLLAFFSIDAQDSANLSTLIWPSAGILLGALMLSPARQWPMWMLIAGVLHTTASLTNSRPPSMALLFTTADLATMAAIAALWRYRVGEACTLTQPRSLFWFIGLVLVGCIAGGLVTDEALEWLHHPTAHYGWSTWAISVGIGCLTGAPLVMAWGNFRVRLIGGPNRQNLLIGLLWFTALLVTAEIAFDGPTSTWVFGDTNYELTYLPLLFVVLVAMVWEERGTTLALVTLALVAGVNTLQGEGPFVFEAQQRSLALIEVQGYVGAAALMGLTMSAINASRQQALQLAAAWKVRFEGALLSSRHLMYEFDPHSGKISWGGEVQALLGLSAASLATLDDFLARVHPDDRQPFIDHAQFNDKGSDEILTQSYRFRFRCADGEYRDAVVTGAPIVDFDGEVYRVDGLLHLESELTMVQRV